MIRRDNTFHFGGTLVEVLSTGFYAGFSPIAPGTFGSIWAIPFVYFIRSLKPWIGGILLLSFVCLSIWLSHKAERHFNRKDPKEVVIDEITGLLLTLYLIPLGLINILGTFLLFRIVDIIKPFPIRRVEGSLNGGFGILVDDLLSALYVIVIWYLVKAVL